MATCIQAEMGVLQVEAGAWGRIPAASFPGAAGSAGWHGRAAGAAGSISHPDHHCRSAITLRTITDYSRCTEF